MSLQCSSCYTVFHDEVSYEVHSRYAHTSNNLPVTNLHNTSDSLTNGDGNFTRSTNTNSETTRVLLSTNRSNSYSSFHQRTEPDPLEHYGDRMYNPLLSHVPPWNQRQPIYPETYNSINLSSLQVKYAQNQPLQNHGWYTTYASERSSVYSNVKNFQFGTSPSDAMSMPGPGSPHAFHVPHPNNVHPVSQSILDLNSYQVLYDQPPNGLEVQKEFICDPNSHEMLYNQPLEGNEHWFTANQQQYTQTARRAPYCKVLENFIPANEVCTNLSDSVTEGSLTSNDETVASLSSSSSENNSASNTDISSSDSQTTNSIPLRKPRASLRPRIHRCSICNRWFTSSGHLKRHYNTTIHKKAVHLLDHGEKKDLENSSRKSPPPQSNVTMTCRVMSPQILNSLPHAPNLVAGPMDLPRGLLFPPSNLQSLPDVQPAIPMTSLQRQQSVAWLQNPNHANNFQGSHAIRMPQPVKPQSTQPMFYPNFEAPHVSTSIHRATPNISSCDLMMEDIPNFDVGDSKLNGMCNDESVLHHGNVGGTSTIWAEDAMVKQAQIKNVKFSMQPAPVGEIKVTSSTGSSLKNGVGKFCCKECNKNFNKSCYLTQHNKSFHGPFKPYRCKRCGKRFEELKQFEMHTEKHIGEGPHKCNQCPKTFIYKTDLKRHRCLHTNSRPYSCDICGKGFIRKDHMTKHRDTHGNRKNLPNKVNTERSKIKKKLMEVTC